MKDQNKNKAIKALKVSTGKKKKKKNSPGNIFNEWNEHKITKSLSENKRY